MKTLLLAMILLSGCAARNQHEAMQDRQDEINEAMEDRADDMQAKAEALLEYQYAEIDLAIAQGKPLTPKQQKIYDHRKAED